MRNLLLVLLLLLFAGSCRVNGTVAVPQSEDSFDREEPVRTVGSESVVSKSKSPAQEEKKPIDTESKESIPQETSKKEDTIIDENKQEQVSSAQKKMSDLIARLENDRAATKEEIAVEEELMMEITGLIFEQTMTKVGYDFYEYFYMLWEPPPEAAGREFNIYISERASPMWGSLVDVSINDTLVWSSVLRPRSVEIEDAVAEAIAVTQQFFRSSFEDQGQIEEMAGTGI